MISRQLFRFSLFYRVIEYSQIGWVEQACFLLPRDVAQLPTDGQSVLCARRADAESKACLGACSAPGSHLGLPASCASFLLTLVLYHGQGERQSLMLTLDRSALKGSHETERTGVLDGSPGEADRFGRGCREGAQGARGSPELIQVLRHALVADRAIAIVS